MFDQGLIKPLEAVDVLHSLEVVNVNHAQVLDDVGGGEN